MIKAGQIYCYKYARRKIIICITKIKDNGFVYVIGNNGTATHRFEGDFESYILIAEYPTWIEAVNSKEFKGV